MSDMTAIGCFVGCVAATLGLIRVCEWLLPRGTRGAVSEGAGKEARR